MIFEGVAWRAKAEGIRSGEGKQVRILRTGPGEGNVWRLGAIPLAR